MSEITSCKNGRAGEGASAQAVVAYPSPSSQPAQPFGALGLYVHVPFCATRCDFCAFYEEAPTAESVRGYLDGMAREVELVAWRPEQPIDTIFWGGGTPGVLAAKDLRRLGEITQACFSRSGGRAFREWSVELAPGSVSEARLEALREIGVTRISMGVQSFQPALLEALGRRHSPEQIYRAYERIRAAGFKSVNLDLMFALPGQDEEAWLGDMREAVAMQPDHLSTYCLTFEEDTALWVKLSQGKVKLDSEREARLYERTWAELDASGFKQYEISNFARPGFECIHNLNTWRMQEWVGLGPSAASQYAGWRGTNPHDLTLWQKGLVREGGGVRATEDRTELSAALLGEDALIFGLRMNEGVDVAALRARDAGENKHSWVCVEALVERLIADGLAERFDANAMGRVRLTLKGRLVADAIGSEMLGALTS